MLRAQLLEPLLDALHDKHAMLRACAAMALGNLGDIDALTALIWIEENDIGEYESAEGSLETVSDRAFRAIMGILTGGHLRAIKS